MTNFKDHKLSISKGDMIYLFTDGYADQFGGKNGKKFKYRQLKHLLGDIKELPLIEQKKKLNQNFEEWQGNLEQVDDVLIIGIKI